MIDTPDVARVAALVGERARGRMLLALMDGSALTATELALEGGVSPSTASSHLAKLVRAGLVTVARQGRQRHFRLGGSAVAEAIEALMAISPRRTGPALRSAAGADGLRQARVCYDHLAGEAGVRLFAALRERGWVRASGAAVSVTQEGEVAFTRLGIGLDRLRASRRPLCRPCLDWSERRFHLAGSLGAALLERLLALGLARRQRGSRALAITPRGAVFLRTLHVPARDPRP